MCIIFLGCWEKKLQNYFLEIDLKIEIEMFDTSEKNFRIFSL